MTIEKLKQLLQQLEGEIQTVSVADPVQQQALAQLKHDLEALMASLHDDTSSPSKPSSTGLQAFLETLETEHPRLALLLEQTIDTLAGMGI
ncbi:MAG: DUF4404 family protein [Cyanophyceae cyanobacterium]